MTLTHFDGIELFLFFFAGHDKNAISKSGKVCEKICMCSDDVVRIFFPFFSFYFLSNLYTLVVFSIFFCFVVAYLFAVPFLIHTHIHTQNHQHKSTYLLFQKIYYIMYRHVYSRTFFCCTQFDDKVFPTQVQKYVVLGEKYECIWYKD